MTTIRERIEAVLEHYDECDVSVNKHDTETRVNIEFPTTIAIVFRDLTITFGADRVSKSKGMVKVTR